MWTKKPQGPLKVIHQRPGKVGANIAAGLDRFVQLRNVSWRLQTGEITAVSTEVQPSQEISTLGKAFQTLGLGKTQL